MAKSRDEVFNNIVGVSNGSSLLEQGINKLVGVLKKRGINHKSQQKPAQKQVNADALIQALSQMGLSEEQLNGVVGVVGDMVQELGAMNAEGAHMLPEQEAPELEISLEEDSAKMDEEIIDEEIVDEKEAPDMKAIAEQLSAIADMIRAMVDDQADMEQEMSSMKSAIKQAQDAERTKGASLESRIANLEKLARAMPKRASTAPDTAVSPDTLPESVKSATRKFDSFWNVPVSE